MTKVTLTQKELKRLFSYNEETGVFTRIVDGGGGTKRGDVAGCKNRAGYIVFRVSGSLYLAHRLAWLYTHGVFPLKIDHVNHDKSDNSMSNLRNVDHQGNMRNTGVRKNNKSGLHGVFWDKKSKSWFAYIDNFGRVGLGYTKSLFDAACARKSAENKYGYHANHGVDV